MGYVGVQPVEFLTTSSGFDLNGTELILDADDDTTITSDTDDQIDFKVGGTDTFTLTSSAVVFNEGSGDIDFRIESNGNADMFKLDANDDTVLIGNTTFENTGHVGVGIADPSNSGLFGGTQVSLNVGGSAAAEVRIKSNASDADTALISSNSSNQFFIINGANGVALAHDGNSFSAASDERKKDIIENITDAETKINKLRAVVGKYKTTDADGTRRSFLIAQDFLNNFPEPVNEVAEIDSDGKETSDTYYQLEYQAVVPLLVAGIKELSAKCADYETRIKALEG